LALADPDFPIDRFCVSEGVYWFEQELFTKCFINKNLIKNMCIGQIEPVGIFFRISTGFWRKKWFWL